MMNGLIVLVPYTTGQEFYADLESGLYDFDEDELEENEDAEEENEPEIAYLPVYVATQDKDLALMAVAHEACSCRYVACPSSLETEQIWREWGYTGTAESPVMALPATEEAYIIPEPGDCFCCASLDEYEVLSLKEMKKRLSTSPENFMLQGMIDSVDACQQLWDQFNQWTEKYLKYSLKLKDQKEPLSVDSQYAVSKDEKDLSLSEAIDTLKDSILQALGRGYSYKEIAIMLRENGIEISTSLLKEYLN